MLRSRRIRGVEFLILQGSDSGTFSVQRAWTDQAFPDVYRDAQISPRILGIEGLLQLVDLLAAVEKKRD